MLAGCEKDQDRFQGDSPCALALTFNAA